LVGRHRRAGTRATGKGGCHSPGSVVTQIHATDFITGAK
jgi:hypothetical protein